MPSCSMFPPGAVAETPKVTVLPLPEPLCPAEPHADATIASTQARTVRADRDVLLLTTIPLLRCSPEHQPLAQLHDDLVQDDTHHREDDEGREHTRRVVVGLLLLQQYPESVLRGHKLAEDRAEQGQDRGD